MKERGGEGDGRPQYPTEEELDALEYLDVPAPRRGALHRILLEDPISQLVPPMPIYLDISDPVSVAARFMSRFRFGSVLVEDDGRLAGIFTEQDLLQKCHGLELDRVKLGDVMTRDPQTLTEEDRLASAVHLMAVGGYRHVPIVRDGWPIGFASVRGILRYISESALEGDGKQERP